MDIANMDQEKIKELQEKGLAWIKSRQAVLEKSWVNEFGKEISGKNLSALARRVADLENDFNFIKETAQAVSIRYDEFIQVLPTLPEMDALIEVLKEMPEDEDQFFIAEVKKVRLEKLKKLRSAIEAMGK